VKPFADGDHTERKPGFRSLGNVWADTTTAHGRLILTVLGGLAEFERDLRSSKIEASFSDHDKTASDHGGSAPTYPHEDHHRGRQYCH
jgi:DNA invertase Pin-like site-specific DNA recombinase